MLEISQADINDDLREIVKLIYQTDPFIYTAMCDGDYAYFEQIMLECLKQESIFFYKNIILAKENGTIAGLLLSFTKEQQLPFQNGAKKIEIRECLQRTLNDYFQALLNKLEHNELCINNLCVGEGHQNKGIGSALLKHLIAVSKEPKIVLDCLEDNASAVALYKKNGFKIRKRFKGFAGNEATEVQCVEFVYEKDMPVCNNL